MRKLLFPILAALSCCFSAYGQSCLPNGISFFAQDEIDNFKFNYPSCKIIEGDVNIYFGDITNLNGLSNITDINGTLSIDDCDGLTNLNGLANLKTLGHLYIAGNDALTSLAGLSKLTTVGGFFFIQDNNALTDLNGLQNLETVGGDFWIHYSTALTDISALNGLTSVGGTIEFNFATALANLNGLNNVQSVGGGLILTWNDLLTNLDGLNGITSPLDSVVIYGNPVLANLNALAGVPSINNDVDIFFSPALASLSGLSGLTTVGGSITLNNNDSLPNLNGLHNIIAIGGSFSMGGNDKIQDMTGLNSLQTIGSNLEIVYSPALENLNGLNQLQSIGRNLKLLGDHALTDLNALQSLSSLGGNLDVQFNHILSNLNGLQGLTTIGDSALIARNENLTSLAGLGNVQSVGSQLLVSQNQSLTSLTGLDNLKSIGGELQISQNQNLTSLTGLDGLLSIGSFSASFNPALLDLSGLNRLASIPSSVSLFANFALTSLSGLDSLAFVGGNFSIEKNAALANLNGLGSLTNVQGNLRFWSNTALADMSSLSHLNYVGGNLDITENAALTRLDSLHNLTAIGGNLVVNYNTALVSLSGLHNLSQIGGMVEITYNNILAECSIPPVCYRVFSDPASVNIYYNALGCKTPAELEENCGTTPVLVSVKMDANGDCLPDATNLPVTDAAVWLSGFGQNTLRPTDASGLAQFRYFDNGPAVLTLAQFPTANWAVCPADTVPFVAGTSPDTTDFLLRPLNACPELAVQLGLPSIFSDCSIVSPVSVFVKNTGTMWAEGVKVAVGMPPEFDLLTAEPQLAGQTGDTLFFEMADLAPLAGTEIRLTVKTKCSGVPTGRALCWSAFGSLDNGCPVNPSPFSEVQLTAECVGGKVLFMLKNIGNAPTQSVHEYTIFRNGAGQTTEPFTLAADESETIEVPADGATYRMEATKLANGMLTAVSHEGCGGFSPGWITAFWQDKGPLASDFDCRQVGDLKYFTGKNAIPAGVGPDRLLAPNRSLQYTIDFRNFEAGSAITQVSLHDALRPELNINSIQPGAASHPYTWQIRHGNLLEVVFDPITLADSNANPAASHGFFTFQIDQRPDLPDGSIVENSADVVFENAYIADRDTFRHIISKVGANSQKCLPTIPGFGFYSQQHIDDFPINYPGCTEIEGDLVIGEYQNDINNLNGFSQLRSVGGSIRISNCGALKTLNGLHNLRHVGQGLSIGAVPLLTDLSGLENLSAIDSVLAVQGCHGLKSLHGLDSLRQVKFVNINYNDSLADLTALARLPHDIFGLSVGGAALTNLQGLEHLDSIGAGGFNIESSALPDLNDLNNIKSVAGDLTIQGNHELGSLAGLSNLLTVGGNFTIYNNSSLMGLDGLSKLTAVGGSFTLYYLENMLQPQGPPNLKTIGGDLSIKGMPQLDNLGGLASLDSIGGYLIFQYNPSQTVATGMPKLRHVGGLDIYGTAMQHLTGLDSLRAIPKNVLIYAMPALLDFKGLGNLETVEGRVDVFQNPVLKDFDGLGKLRSVGDSLMVWGNAELVNFAGMTAFQEVGKQAYFYDNAALANFAGLENLHKIGDSLLIFNNPVLTSMAGLSSLDSIGGDFWVHNNQALNSLAGLDNLRYIGEDFDITDNSGLTQLIGLEQLERIGGDFMLGANWFPNSVTSLQGLGNLVYVGGNFSVPENLQGFNGVENLAFIGGNLEIDYNPIMTSLSGLEELETVGGNLQLNLPLLTNLHGLEKLTTVGGWLSIYSGVLDLTGLGNLKSIGGDFGVTNTIKSYEGIENLESIGGNVTVDNLYMKDFSGFGSLKSIGGYFRIAYNQALENLHGLENLTTVGSDFRIDNNPKLLTLDGLDNLDSVGGAEFWVLENPLLSDCDIYFICNKYFTDNSNPFVATFNNAPGCDAWWEVKAACNAIPVHATVRIDNNGDCLPDPADTPVEDVRIQLSGGNGQMSLRPTGADGAAQFRYFNNGDFTLYLPAFPSANWNVCQDDQHFSPGPPGPLPDTIEANFLLSPGQMPCPELEVELGLPSVFRNCLVNSDMAVSVKNTGDAVAEFVTVAVVKPREIELLASVPPLTAQIGDTLYFELGDIAPLTAAVVQMKVRTNCNFFLFQRTLCFEAYAETLLPCPTTPLASSEIKLSIQCLADTAVHFTLKNIGDAPTLAPHQYILYRNTTPVDTADFNLAAHETLTLQLLADGSTHRMEATKRDDGTRTAAALEGCGGFTSGMINAFWLDKGPLEYDFDCREVVGSFDPNQKTAVPTGIGADHLLAANYPLIYTIDFQNTGTDTARRVLLRDVLSANLDVSTFRPGFASHPYTWEIRGADSLDVLFFPIALPDSNVNEPASHGFFTFTIDQKPDLPDGTTLENTAEIIFDFNPPIVTNTVRHSIGQLSVAVDEAQEHWGWWQVLGNPTRETATFLAKKFISGEKRFELIDASGRVVRRANFDGQSFDLKRDVLASGLYFFRIGDEQGRWFTGKIVVTD